uniref:Uncharacterized protein n=1 Tax=Rousettus aegyptiacus TaxID=9407 RepID=A0A7J8JHV6_ROUAE|nr:hypothetical protein HJG63_010225 [Rousettus aegyptiacus]
MHIQKAKYLKDATLQKRYVSFCCSNGRVGTCAQAQQWGWTQGQWPKRMLNFCCTCLKMQSDAELQNLDADSLVTEHTKGNKASRMRNVQNSWADELYMSIAPLPDTRRRSSLKRSRVFLSQKRSLHRRKKMSQEKLKKQN